MNLAALDGYCVAYSVRDPVANCENISISFIEVASLWCVFRPPSIHFYVNHKVQTDYMQTAIVMTITNVIILPPRLETLFLCWNTGQTWYMVYGLHS